MTDFPIWATNLVEHWLRGHELAVLDARQQAVSSLQAYFSCQLQEALSESFQSLSRALQPVFTTAYEDQGRLRRLFNAAVTELEEVNQALPKGISADPFCKVLPLDSLVNWSLARWTPLPADLRCSAAGDGALLEGWPDIDPQIFARELCRTIEVHYAPLKAASLLEIAQQLPDLGIAHLLQNLSLRTMPLLRPNFDRLGGAPARDLHYVLFDPQNAPLMKQFLADHPDSWRPVYTCWQQKVCFCSIRPLVPLEALVDLQKSGEKQYLALDSADRLAYHAFQEWAPTPPGPRTNGNVRPMLAQC